MSIKRIGKHLLEHRWRVRRIFPPEALAVIERTIKAGEETHSGQVRFVVEGALDGKPLFWNQSARERALDIFSQLQIWDTAHNNGVLIYLLLADRQVEIVADRGIDAKVGAAGWKGSARPWRPISRRAISPAASSRESRRSRSNWRRIFQGTGRGRTSCPTSRW